MTAASPQLSKEHFLSGNLFIGLRPDSETASHIFDRGAQLRETLGFPGRPRPADILHVTLHGLDPRMEISTEPLHAASQACEKASHLSSPFPVQLAQVMSFGQPGNRALVLTQRKNDNLELKAFHYALGAELKREGFRIRGSFTPHVTIAYGPEVDPASVEPLNWRVEEFSLILSHIGQTRYSVLESWKLRGDQPATIKEPPSQGEFGF